MIRPSTASNATQHGAQHGHVTFAQGGRIRRAKQHQQPQEHHSTAAATTSAATPVRQPEQSASILVSHPSGVVTDSSAKTTFVGGNESAFLTGVSPIERRRPHSAMSANASRKHQQYPLLELKPPPSSAFELFGSDKGHKRQTSTEQQPSTSGLPPRFDVDEDLGIETRGITNDSQEESFFKSNINSFTASKERVARPSSALSVRMAKYNHLADSTWSAYMDIATRDVRQRQAEEEVEAQEAQRKKAERDRYNSLVAANAKLDRTQKYLNKRRASKIGRPSGNANDSLRSAGGGGGGGASPSGRRSGSIANLEPSAEDFDMAFAQEQSRICWERLTKKAVEGNSLSLQATKRAFGMTPMEKLQHMRKNPEDRRELAARMAEAEKVKKQTELKNRGDIKNRNKRLLENHQRYYHAALQATSQMRAKQRMESAKKKREGLQSWKMARAIDDLQRPEFLRLQRTKATEIEILQNSWLVMIFASAALCEMHDKMLEELKNRNERQRLRKFTYANAVLQQNIHQRQTVRLVRASNLIWNYWLRARDRIREKKKRVAIVMVRKFLLDLGESVKIPIAVKKKLRYVRMLQRAFRTARTMRKLRITMGGQQLEQCLQVMFTEDDREIQQLKATHKQFQKEIANKRGIHRIAKNEMIQEHAQQTETQVMYLTRRQKTVVSMTKELQLQLVVETMEKKTVDFSNQAYRYGVALKFYYREMENLKRQGLGVDTQSGNVYRLGTGKVLTAEEIASDQYNIPTKVPAKPIKPYLRSLFTKEEIGKIVSRGMEIIQLEQSAAKGGGMQPPQPAKAAADKVAPQTPPSA